MVGQVGGSGAKRKSAKTGETGRKEAKRVEMGAISQAHFEPVSFCFITKSRLRVQVNRCKLLITLDLSSPASYKCYYVKY